MCWIDCRYCVRLLRRLEAADKMLKKDKPKKKEKREKSRDEKEKAKGKRSLRRKTRLFSVCSCCTCGLVANASLFVHLFALIRRKMGSERPFSRNLLFRPPELVLGSIRYELTHILSIGRFMVNSNINAFPGAYGSRRGSHQRGFIRPIHCQ